MVNLNSHFEKSIKELVHNVLKSSRFHPRELWFLFRFNKASKKAAKLRAESEKNGTHIPPFLIASIADECNLFCKGCYARANHSCGKAAKGKLTPARWEEIFTEASQLGINFILLAGGEPLMEREIIERAAKHQDIIFPIFTNGTMIEGGYLKLFQKNRNLLPLLSIEGGEEATDSRRGKGVYQKLLSAMSALRQKRLLFGASVTVSKANLHEVTSDAFIDNIHESGCRVLFFVEYVPADGVSFELCPDDGDRVILEARKNLLSLKYPDMILLCFPGDEKQMGGCLAAGRGFFHINASGNAEPCPFSPFSDTNLSNHTILEVLKSPLFTKLKESGLLQEPHNGGCTLFQREEQVKELLK